MRRRISRFEVFDRCLPPTGARFSAAPPRIVGFATFPVRAYASVPD